MTNDSGVYLETSSRTGETYVITENDDKPFAIHKLVAVAEYGIKKVVNNDVYHLNTIAWDNRPNNLELTEDSSMTEFARRGYWKMVDGEPQLHQYNGTIKEFANSTDVKEE